VFIRIEPASGVPITRQIMDQVRTQCASAALKPGERIPSVRELARSLAVNQNTILRAYERLTAEGLLERRHGEGTFVAQFRTAPRMKQEHAALKGEAERLVRRAATLGLAAADVRAILDDALAAHLPQQQEAD
jgi:GntR family transcriptional regulator